MGAIAQRLHVGLVTATLPNPLDQGCARRGARALDAAIDSVVGQEGLLNTSGSWVCCVTDRVVQGDHRAPGEGRPSIPCQTQCRICDRNCRARS